MQEFLEQFESALARRNPGAAAALQPPLAEDQIRKDLKRLGIKDRIDPIIALYTWHNGARFIKEDNAYHQGFAPPLVSTLDAKTIEFMQGIGAKFDPNKKIYNAYTFFSFEGGIGDLKRWKKFAPKLPDCSLLAGRFFPFMLNKAGDQLAIDLTPQRDNRVVVIANDKRVIEAYDTFESFLQDLIRANETGELLTCVKSPGKPIDLPPPDPALVKPKPSKAGPKLPATENPILLRTHFADAAAWDALKAAVAAAAASTDESPDLAIIDDATFADIAPDKLRTLLPDDAEHTFAFLADATAMTDKEHPILVIDLSRRKVKTFRVTPAALGEVAANLSLANMEFDEFAKAAARDAAGIFRGVDQT